MLGFLAKALSRLVVSSMALLLLPTLVPAFGAALDVSQMEAQMLQSRSDFEASVRAAYAPYPTFPLTRRERLERISGMMALPLMATGTGMMYFASNPNLKLLGASVGAIGLISLGRQAARLLLSFLDPFAMHGAEEKFVFDITYEFDLERFYNEVHADYKFFRFKDKSVFEQVFKSWAEEGIAIAQKTLQAQNSSEVFEEMLKDLNTVEMQLTEKFRLWRQEADQRTELAYRQKLIPDLRRPKSKLQDFFNRREQYFLAQLHFARFSIIRLQLAKMQARQLPAPSPQNSPCGSILRLLGPTQQD